ncbi:hypothetical protein L207DRAFT_343812 [Hyaloscypha variabilis F]|uniref:Uncharacterized protein n=1 Tax=Hyaloscypha variabilis (strain UAMH 11265 / GT02V1 / F) TaxID=1149755 RepID=A0A2J6RQB4_HYAVF|nr:hypothetical protein L207DRAFT_343812 [Hyaloscypha variabilis F]
MYSTVKLVMRFNNFRWSKKISATDNELTSQFRGPPGSLLLLRTSLFCLLFAVGWIDLCKFLSARLIKGASFISTRGSV